MLAYYRRQRARLFGLLVLALREQAHVGWPRALVASVYLTKAAAGFARATGDYDRFAPDIGRAYRLLRLPEQVDAESRRAATSFDGGWSGAKSGWRPAMRRRATPSRSCTPRSTRSRARSVAEAGRLRGVAAEVRDRGANDDPDGPTGPGRAYWPEVARLLRDSYRSLQTALDEDPGR